MWAIAKARSRGTNHAGTFRVRVVTRKTRIKSPRVFSSDKSKLSASGTIGAYFLYERYQFSLLSRTLRQFLEYIKALFNCYIKNIRFYVLCLSFAPETYFLVARLGWRCRFSWAPARPEMHRANVFCKFSARSKSTSHWDLHAGDRELPFHIHFLLPNAFTQYAPRLDVIGNVCYESHEKTDKLV